jgi:hypothetical protein
MFSAIGRRMRVSPTTVIATLALVFAMTGGAYAAKKYLITSTRQISPSVLKSLKGANGANGANGAAGAQGAQGAQGPAGPAGVKGETGPHGPEGKEGKQGTPGINGTTGFTETLPEGKSELGTWTASGVATETGKLYTSSISFAIPLASTVPARYIGLEEGEGEEHQSADIPGECTGTARTPGAVKGHLCIFASRDENAEAYLGVYHALTPQASVGQAGVEQAGTAGAVVLIQDHAIGFFWEMGTWAVTAPEG